MAGPLTDAEKQLLRIKEAEERAAYLKERIAYAEEQGIATGIAKQILATIESNLELMKSRTAGSLGLLWYRCYFMKGERIAAGEDFLCSDDMEAVSMAAKLLADSAYSGAEVWQQGRKVDGLSNPGEQER